jgi:putative thiamine transport system substrate-binding protein
MVMRRLNRRNLVQLALGLPLVPLFAGIAKAQDWAATEAEARGQTVYFNAWAGSETINAYIAWAGKEIEARYGVKLAHVKVADAAEVVRRVRDEVKAGRQDGSVDLVWINGENFRAMKADRLLYGPFAEDLPNYRFVDIEGKPTTLVDFAESVEGLESPWGMAQLTFFGDSTKIAAPPASMQELQAFAAANPGRVTYPAPPDFHGTTFVKQVLLETIGDRNDLQLTIGTEDFTKDTEPLWAFLNSFHPHLWREGKQFPQSQAQMKQMLADGELLMALTFNPNEPANMVANQELPATTIAWQHAAGTIGNTHFVAIPINAQAKAGAQIIANFLLSPEAQARKADLKVWGDPTVLDLSKLSPEQAALFAGGDVPGGVVAAGPPLPEPHASWVPLLEAAWLERYGA